MGSGYNMHALEKILATHAGKKEVSPGEIINCKVDLAAVNDLYLQVIKSFQEMGGQKVKDPEKVAFIFDHYAPAPTIKAALNQKIMREFVREQKIKYLFDVDAGICHQILPESGLVWPGMLLIMTDSHTTTHGAFGAFGTGVGATDLAVALLTGELWFRVPEIIRINVDGYLQPGVMAKDVILHIIGTLKQDAAIYKAIEFTGSTVKELSIDGRMVLTNMSVEMGAKTSYIQPDNKTLAYLKSRVKKPFKVYTTDPGYKYAEEFLFEVEKLEPQVAVPHTVDNVVSVSEVEGVEVDQVFIGSCTGGRLEDIEIAARILKNKKINKNTRLIVGPASKNVLLEAINAGYIDILLKAGATIIPPGCGPCLGAHQGVLAPGEVGVTTSSRNFPGRMGSREAKIYITSPATAAATALEGKIADPRKYIKE
ncbi:3-isopropylmalate dehydratase large subunit [Thermococcus aggregans]|uniref:3-isopropylmalate dehydratase large subunit n=1 Tax=Thermococcus aggregans TaxID=110163 RepID=A0A9E7MXK2_THEAG|nr:3-isopropylmalate dehydratase large subunit [Thermococcus aggregans]USS40667.1 3-isopropylmalate dehydratase large subunit [Thermococcus aggregans]